MNASHEINFCLKSNFGIRVQHGGCHRLAGLGACLATLVLTIGLGGSRADAKPDAGEGRESSPGVIAFSRPLESTDVFMVNEDGSGEHKLATLRNRPSYLSFSPSGKKLAYIHLPANWKERGNGDWMLSSPGDLVVKDLAGGSTKTVYAH